MTFRAIVRRNGRYTNAQGPHDWNEQLCEPIMRGLGNNWEKVFARRLPLILAGFTRRAKILLGKFHSEIEKRCLERGVGIAGMAMLKQQLHSYDTEFAELVQAINQIATESQREANRGFQPVIESEMVPSYEYCAGECGTGCYMRMKSQMGGHIEAKKNSMFRNSTNSVRDQLKTMCRLIENDMADGADGAFIRIRRDYMQVVGGVKLPHGQAMSKTERIMRAEICEILEDNEKIKEESGEMDAQDGESANGQLQSEAHEAADRTESDDVKPRIKSSPDASSKKITDSEEDESEYDDCNEEDKENHSEHDGDDSMEADGSE